MPTTPTTSFGLPLTLGALMAALAQGTGTAQGRLQGIEEAQQLAAQRLQLQLRALAALAPFVRLGWEKYTYSHPSAFQQQLLGLDRMRYQDTHQLHQSEERHWNVFDALRAQSLAETHDWHQIEASLRKQANQIAQERASIQQAYDKGRLSLEARNTALRQLDLASLVLARRWSTALSIFKALNPLTKIETSPNPPSVKSIMDIYNKLPAVPAISDLGSSPSNLPSPSLPRPSQPHVPRSTTPKVKSTSPSSSKKSGFNWSSLGG